MLVRRTLNGDMTLSHKFNRRENAMVMSPDDDDYDDDEDDWDDDED
jgi:hypothetical protein